MGPLKKPLPWLGVAATAAALLLGVVCSGLLIDTALAKPDKVDGVNVPSGRIPQEIKNNKYPRTYFPNTEKLAKDEMRITALGTGMPNQSPSNVAASFLVELGNGESFLFDLGMHLPQLASRSRLQVRALQRGLPTHRGLDRVLVGTRTLMWIVDPNDEEG